MTVLDTVMNTCPKHQFNSKLNVCDVSKSFGEKVVLRDVNLELFDGEIVSLLGVSGAGKTTLFNIISGLLKPDKGSVFLDGSDITGMSGKVSYMLQKDLLMQHLTVADNVALPLVIKGESKKNARKKVITYFEQFGLEGTESSYPSQLSGGMRQRAALLRTYMSQCAVALLDEPFSALDAITKSNMHRWYQGVMKSINLSTIFITHDIEEAILLSDRIYILGGDVKQEIKILAPHPRPREFTITDEFITHKAQILKALE